MNQHRILHRHNLLDEKGRIIESGYATELILDYNRENIKANSLRIKEWDYYYIGSDKTGIAFVIADNAYMGLASASVMDFTKGKDITDFALIPFPMGKMKLPLTSVQGDVSYSNKKMSLDLLNDGIIRKIKCNFKDFKKTGPLVIDIELYDAPKDTMVIVTPYKEDPRAFYYNQKINCMKVRGFMEWQGKRLDLSNFLATLDWGRGVWTYDNTWYWGTMSTILDDGKAFGFNIGYGFGDTSAASENMLFYDGVAHKLSLIDFGIPVSDGKDDIMSEWNMKTDDGRLDMTFKPVFDRRTDLNALIIAQDAHQVFGKFSGKAILDDGRAIEFKDKMGFAEKVRNKW